MKLIKQHVENPDFEKLAEMKVAMRRLLENEQNSGISLEELCAFQNPDGSFNLFDSYDLPNDAKFDFCFFPTYIGASILMKELLKGNRNIIDCLCKALNVSFKSGMIGHGYESEEGRIEAMNVFIAGGLKEFLETQRSICPEFHQTINNIIHYYNLRLIQKRTKGFWNEDYSDKWRSIVDQLQTRTRLYAAYGSNLDRAQMINRCPDAKIIGKAYLRDWKRTMPFYANIEKEEGHKTAALIWELSEKDEKSLNRFEGYPDCYVKTDVIADMNGKDLSVMVYVMTEEYKTKNIKPREGYLELVKKGYADAGFEKREFCVE